MSIDTNKDGTTDAGEILTAVQGFLSATFKDANRLLQTALLVLTTAATLWTMTHPAAAVPVPTTGPVPVPALPDAPKASEPSTDTDAPPPAPVDAVTAPDAVKP